MAGAEDYPVRPTPARLRLSPTEAAIDLTDFIFGDEQSGECVSFLALMTTAAAKYGIRESTLSGTGDIALLNSQLLSGVDKGSDTRSSYQASCRVCIDALRARCP